MKHFKKIKLLFVAIALFSYSHICHAGDTGDESVVLWYTNGEKLVICCQANRLSLTMKKT